MSNLESLAADITPTRGGLPYSISLARISTLDSLRQHLQWAIELEHFTVR
jgi:hypothetical protein